MQQGKIFLVGFGPGAHEHMSLRALEAIEAADTVIGYSTYIKLVQHLLDDKEIIRKGMTEEVDRCLEAWEHAKQGKTVALISSGDAGIYGMAGPTYEVLFQHGWTPEHAIKVEVVPGTTALNAAAALVGAPLTHDFCAVSLSDLLTPWPKIYRRIEAAASSDFVIALYNPKSGRRTQQIVEAQKILLRHRDPQTPVAVVKSAYRKRQKVEMTTLKDMADCDIGMLTTVLIGNSSTIIKEGIMLTPRGYANKYEDLTGQAREGEKAGRSLSMGLDGWMQCVCDWMQQNPEASLDGAAKHFDMPLGSILEAVSHNPHSEGFQSLAIQNFDNILESMIKWGEIRAVVRSETGATTECFVYGRQLQQKHEWLNVSNDYFHLHIDCSKISVSYLCQCDSRHYALHCIDQHGKLIARFMMIKVDGIFYNFFLTAFLKAWEEQSQ
ncbi:MAG: precorrin-3B C(17)-methyltransferase [Mariprofundaceae bacterium]|nr:precorrin-3B C(17)-methyltransferase [Mariprofundaceae bacterium]